MEWNMYANVNVISFVLTYLLLCSSKELQFLLMSSMKNKTDKTYIIILKRAPNTYSSHLVFPHTWGSIEKFPKNRFSLTESLAILRVEGERHLF